MAGPFPAPVLGTTLPTAPGLCTDSRPGLPVYGPSRLLQARTPPAGICPLHAGLRKGTAGLSLSPGWLRLLCQQSGKTGREAGALGASPVQKEAAEASCPGHGRDTPRASLPLAPESLL